MMLEDLPIRKATSQGKTVDSAFFAQAKRMEGVPFLQMDPHDSKSWSASKEGDAMHLVILEEHCAL